MPDAVKQSVAMSPSGQDAFAVIAERLIAARKPVDSVIKVAHELPAGEMFMAFAKALALATDLYQSYLESDARALEHAHAAAMRAAENVPLALPVGAR